MLKVWKGPEMEGALLGTITLFICSNTQLRYKDIQEFLVQGDISKVYLGAGRQDFLGFVSEADFILFKKYCMDNSISVTIETTPDSLPLLTDYLDFAEIIITIRNANIPVTSNIVFKLDDYKTARLFDNHSYYDTDLSDVSNNRYSCDTVLYEKED